MYTIETFFFDFVFDLILIESNWMWPIVAIAPNKDGNDIWWAWIKIRMAIACNSVFVVVAVLVVIASNQQQWQSIVVYTFFLHDDPCPTIDLDKRSRFLCFGLDAFYLFLGLYFGPIVFMTLKRNYLHFPWHEPWLCSLLCDTNYLTLGAFEPRRPLSRVVRPIVSFGQTMSMFVS